jgi:hypothetical protein
MAEHAHHCTQYTSLADARDQYDVGLLSAHLVRQVLLVSTKITGPDALQAMQSILAACCAAECCVNGSIGSSFSSQLHAVVRADGASQARQRVPLSAEALCESPASLH